MEGEEKLTRRCLEVLAKSKHPVSIITKNALVLRDLDLLSELASEGLAGVAISLTTLDEDLRRVLEPRTSKGANRVKAIRALSEAGIPVHVWVAPIIPGLSDREVPALLKSAAEAGARSASYTVLRTNGAVEQIFRTWLQQHFPDRAAKVIGQTSALHGGRMNDSICGRRMKGEGPHAESIKRPFTVFRKRYSGDRTFTELDRSKFFRPPVAQLDLFT